MGAKTLVLPIWIATWELDCCQPDATVGHPWTAPLILRPGSPWWVREAGADQPPDHEAPGTVDLDIEITMPSHSEQDVSFGHFNGLPIAVYGVLSTGSAHLRGQLWYDGHAGPGRVDLDDIQQTGVVRRVRRVPLVYEEQEPKTYVPVAQLDPVDVHSTLDRAKEALGQGAHRHLSDTLLVDLEIQLPQ